MLSSWPLRFCANLRFSRMADFLGLILGAFGFSVYSGHESEYKRCTPILITHRKNIIVLALSEACKGT